MAIATYILEHTDEGKAYSKGSMMRGWFQERIHNPESHATVKCYHVDTVEGLRVLSDKIRGRWGREMATPEERQLSCYDRKVESPQPEHLMQSVRAINQALNLNLSSFDELLGYLSTELRNT